ncbi:MAG: Gfo/Idh/MocA family oxidoreductase [SAR324 cluster bacterium]|nr:Gfo/Idh/MocA family oxidoreductase [SAR324 cluster bacterium]
MINAAIFGLGKWGNILLDSVQGKSSKIRIAAVITRTVDKYEELAKEKGFSLVDNYHTVLENPDIDAVILATPHSLHEEHVKKAAAAGKHVFVEKPFTLTKSSAERAVQACIENKVVLAVGFNRRFLPAFIEMKKMIASDKIGTILHIESQFSGPSAYRRDPRSWRATRSENPGGGMTARGIHTLDLMIHLCGEVNTLSSMSGRRATSGEVDDTTAMLLQFKNGSTGYLSTIMATGNFWRIHVFGSKGWIEMKGMQSLTVSDLDGIVDSVQFDDLDTEKAELESFAESISSGNPFVVTPQEAIHGIAVLEAIEESAQSGLRVSVR